MQSTNKASTGNPNTAINIKPINTNKLIPIITKDFSTPKNIINITQKAIFKTPTSACMTIDIIFISYFFLSVVFY